MPLGIAGHLRAGHGRVQRFVRGQLGNVVREVLIGRVGFDAFQRGNIAGQVLDKLKVLNRHIVVASQEFHKLRGLGLVLGVSRHARAPGAGGRDRLAALKVRMGRIAKVEVCALHGGNLPGAAHIHRHLSAGKEVGALVRAYLGADLPGVKGVGIELARLNHFRAVGIAGAHKPVLAYKLRRAQALRQGQQLVGTVDLLKHEAIDLLAVFIHIGKLLAKLNHLLPGQAALRGAVGIGDPFLVKQVLVVIQLYAGAVQRQRVDVLVIRHGIKRRVRQVFGRFGGNLVLQRGQIALKRIIGNHRHIHQERVDAAFAAAKAHLDGLKHIVKGQHLHIDFDPGVLLLVQVEGGLKDFQVGHDEEVKRHVLRKRGKRQAAHAKHKRKCD